MSSATQATDLADLLRHAKVYSNLSAPALIEHAVRRGEAHLASNGAVAAYTGRTGRSPRDKFTIKDAITTDKVAWGAVNQPLDPEKFEALYEHVMEYLRTREIFVQDLFAGADAFVAANLWDVPAKLGLRVTPGAATVSASVAW